MRATWSGLIQFGMVALPIRLYAATEEHAVRLHEIHTKDGSRVEHQRFCRAEGREIPAGEVGRGFAMPDGHMVPITEDDLARLPLPTKHVIEVLGFVPGQEADPISFSRPYYAGPDGPGADRPYALLVEALARTGYVGIAKIAIRSRERLALLRPRNGVLVVHTLLWQDELREPGELAPAAPVTDRELELAEVLIRELTGIEGRELHDEYTHALEQLVAAKAGQGELMEPPEAPPPGDLMAALEESVRAARAKS
ncbi:Ku protein [Streptomyces sirii]|uniref:non-homologous end joining protein Ku n=1 Tax=Streptomyces sirii TaxID=3127701 RepID=UPI003D36D2B0